MKKLTGKQRMALAVKHFDEILKLYPDNTVDVYIHNVSRKDIDSRVWEQQDRGDRHPDVFRRKSVNRTFDIVLFTKENE